MIRTKVVGRFLKIHGQKPKYKLQEVTQQVELPPYSDELRKKVEEYNTNLLSNPNLNFTQKSDLHTFQNLLNYLHEETRKKAYVIRYAYIEGKIPREVYLRRLNLLDKE